jgi:two-component system chemotaxis response regulator CheY
MQSGTTDGFHYLVVDDSEFARKSLITLLSRVGGTLAGEAVSGQDALQKYRSLKPDIVFMDVNMPGMEGIDALERLLREDSGAKVVIVTSLSHDSLVKDALNKGAKYFITKPVHDVPLARIVRFVLEH